MKKIIKDLILFCFVVLIVGCSSSTTYTKLEPLNFGMGSYFYVRGGEKIDASLFVTNAKYSFKNKDSIDFEFDLNDDFSPGYKAGSYKGTGVIVGDVNEDTREDVAYSTNKRYKVTTKNYTINVVFENGLSKRFHVSESRYTSEYDNSVVISETFDSNVEWNLNFTIKE